MSQSLQQNPTTARAAQVQIEPAATPLSPELKAKVARTREVLKNSPGHPEIDQELNWDDARHVSIRRGNVTVDAVEIKSRSNARVALSSLYLTDDVSKMSPGSRSFTPWRGSDVAVVEFFNPTRPLTLPRPQSPTSVKDGAVYEGMVGYQLDLANPRTNYGWFDARKREQEYLASVTPGLKAPTDSSVLGVFLVPGDTRSLSLYTREVLVRSKGVLNGATKDLLPGGTGFQAIVEDRVSESLPPQSRGRSEPPQVAEWKRSINNRSLPPVRALVLAGAYSYYADEYFSEELKSAKGNLTPQLREKIEKERKDFIDRVPGNVVDRYALPRSEAFAKWFSSDR